MKRVVVVSAAQEAAHVLREMILGKLGEGEWLIGSEDEVMAGLGVSRTTVRQAVRLLEQDQILTVRRGTGGGLFARRPTQAGVVHMASVFLRAAGTSYGDLIRTLGLVSSECAAMIASGPDPSSAEGLTRFYERVLGDQPLEGMSGDEFVYMSGGFFRELSALTGSTMLRLFVAVLIDLARPAAGPLYDLDRMRQTVERHQGVARAVADGQPALAVERMTAHFERVIEWADSSVDVHALYMGGGVASRSHPGRF